MTSDDTTTKSEPAAKPASTPADGATKTEGSATKTEAGEPGNYSRGEGQKPISRAYRENWNLIFGEKAEKSAKRASAKRPSATKTKAKAQPKAKAATKAKVKPKAAKRKKR